MCWNLYWNDESVGHAVILPGWIVASPLWKWACQGGSSVIRMQTQVVQILVPKRTFRWLGPPSLHQVLMLSEFCLSIKLETFYFRGENGITYSVIDAFIFMETAFTSGSTVIDNLLCFELCSEFTWGDPRLTLNTCICFVTAACEIIFLAEKTLENDLVPKHPYLFLA